MPEPSDDQSSTSPTSPTSPNSPNSPNSPTVPPTGAAPAHQSEPAGSGGMSGGTPEPGGSGGMDQPDGSAGMAQRDSQKPVDPLVDPMAALLGGGDLSGLLQAAQEMQAELASAQAQAAETIVEGVSGGGAVRIEATAGLEFRAVHVRPDVVEGADVEMLEDLILAALRDVVGQANQVHTDALGDLGGLGGLGGALPGA